MTVRQRISYILTACKGLLARGGPLLLKAEACLRQIFPYRGQVPLFLMHMIVWLVILYAHPTFFSAVIGAFVSGLGWVIFLWTEGYEVHAARQAPCGPFRYSRHPYLFIGFLVILGLCLASRAFIPLVLLLTAGGMWVQLGMRMRDSQQSDMSHQEFLRYRLFIASFLPTLLPYPVLGVAQPFSVKRAFFTEHHRVLKGLLLLAVLYCALFIYPSLTYAHLWRLGSAFIYGVWMIKHFFFHDIGHKLHKRQGIRL